MNIKRAALLSGLACALCSGTAQAALLTSAIGYTGPTLDIGSYANAYYTFTAGPITFANGITYSSTSGSSVVGSGGYGLGDNGRSTDGIVGSNGTASTITLSLPHLVSSFGLFLNYAVSNRAAYGMDPTITALNSSGEILASYDLLTAAPISSPGGLNAYEFRGISSSTADIAAFQLAGSYIIAQSGVSAVPLPASAPMFGAALLALVGFSYGLNRWVAPKGKPAATSV